MNAADEMKLRHEDLVKEHGEIDGHIHALVERRQKIAHDINALCVAARLFGSELPALGGVASIRPNGTPTVRDFVLAALASSDGSVRTANLRSSYADQYGVQVHPKTMGMTLFRLKRDGLAHRKGGHNWFPGQQQKEN